jgi:hypothetical protein
MRRGNDDDEYITLDDDADSVYDFCNEIMIVCFTDLSKGSLDLVPPSQA